MSSPLEIESGGGSTSEDENSSLDDFEVISAECSDNGEPIYTVRRRDLKNHHSSNEAALIWWRAKHLNTTIPINWKQIKGEARQLVALNSPVLVHMYQPHIHHLTNILYIATEKIESTTLMKHIDHCKKANVIFRENFIWHFLHQIVLACYSVRQVKLLNWHKTFHSQRIYIDSQCNIKIDIFVPSIDDLLSQSKCQNDVCKIGPILYHMCTLNEYNEERKYEFYYGNDLHNILDKLLHLENNLNCKMTCEVLLYHPTVLSHLDNSKEMFIERVNNIKNQTNDSAFESDESLKNNISSLKLPDESQVSESSSEKNNSQYALSPTLIALDLKIPGYVPRKHCDVKKWKSRLDLCKEPQEVSENALSKVWLDRLKDIKMREEAVILKEKEIEKKKVFDDIRSKIANDDNKSVVNMQQNIEENVCGITLQSVMSEKVIEQINNHNKSDIEHIPEFKSIQSIIVDTSTENCKLVKKPLCRSRSKTRYKKKTMMNYEDMDSSLSADPGDNSFIATSTKLSSTIVPRPIGFSNISKRKVHFNSRNNPFAEYDTVTKTVHTIYNIDNNTSYEVPIKNPVKSQNFADRISKFTYLDLEAITNKKRLLLEENKKNIESKYSEGKFQSIDDSEIGNYKRKLRKIKYVSPKPTKMSSQHAIYNSSESSGISTLSYPCMTKIRDHRKSMPLSLSNWRLSASQETVDKFDSKGSEIMTRSKTSKLNNKFNFSIFNKNFGKNKSDLAIVSNKENCSTPISNNFVRDSKRKSILGFKTPFKFNL